MARIDAFYLEDPCSGSRRMVDYLASDGIPISRDRVRNLMRRTGLRAIYQKPRTTVPGEPSERYPCLVDLRQVRAVDQVWATDITYIPLQKGFLYLGPPEREQTDCAAVDLSEFWGKMFLRVCGKTA